MTIVVTTVNDAEIISSIISESNQGVADEFGLNIDNTPKHPSFCTKQWVLADFDRGEEYFLYKQESTYIGCVAFKNPRPGVAYLNRLSVLPKYRHNRVGEALVKHVLNYAKTKHIRKVSLGIIAEHIRLKNWYLNLGFIEGKIQTFPHLPFDVQYMNSTL